MERMQPLESIAKAIQIFATLLVQQQIATPTAKYLTPNSPHVYLPEKDPASKLRDYIRHSKVHAFLHYSNPTVDFQGCTAKYTVI